MRTILLLIFAYLFPMITWGQVVCSGTIKDNYNQTIPSASVLFKDENNNIKHYGFSDEDGHYAIPIEKSMDYIVEVNTIGFEKQQKKLHADKNTKNYTLDFQLTESVEELETIVIDVESPIKERGDTLVFDAKAFTFGNEKTVEDLLKNIPGIEISKEGKIWFENRPIQKVMVDGDDLFNNGYSLLTKNMPNDPLDKVEVLQKYSNNKLLKGIENSSAVALNLTIQDEYKSMWFGNLDLNLGYIDDFRYDSSANLMNFGKKYKNFLNLSGNNVGIDRIGSLEDMFYNNYEIETVGSSVLSPIMYVGSGGVSQLRDYRTRNNNAKHATLSTLFPINEKIKLKVTGFLGFDKQIAFQQSFESFSYNEVAFENKTFKDDQTKFFKGYLNVMGTYDINANNSLQMSSVFNRATKDYKSLFVFNEESTHESLDTRQDFFDQKITYTHRWNEKNAVVFKNRFFSTELPQQYAIDDYLLGNLFANNPDRVENQIQNKKTFFGSEADIFLKQYNDDLIRFQLGYKYEKQHLKTHFQLFENEQLFSPSDFQADTEFALGDLYARGGYSWNWEKITLGTQAEIHQLMNQWKSLESDENKYPLFINPSANASVKISPTQDFSANYRYTISSNDLLQTNDSYLLTSSRSFKKGLGKFEQINQHSMGANYKISHYLNRYNVMVGVNYNKQDKDFSTKSTISQNQSLSQTILIRGREVWNGLLKANYYVRPWSSNFKFETNYSYSTFYNKINNNELRKINSQNQSFKFEWHTSFNRAFNFHLATEWSVYKTASQTFASSQTSAFSFLDITWDFEQIDGKFSVEHYYFGGLPTDQRNHVFLDFEASYEFKDSDWEINISAKNLLNKETFSTRYVSDTGYSENTYQLMKRYILVGTKFRFNLR